MFVLVNGNKFKIDRQQRNIVWIKTNNNNNQILDLLFKHIKMTVSTSVLWKLNIQLAKKWPKIVVKYPLIIVISFDSDYSTSNFVSANFLIAKFIRYDAFSIASLCITLSDKIHSSTCHLKKRLKILLQLRGN